MTKNDMFLEIEEQLLSNIKSAEIAVERAKEHVIAAGDAEAKELHKELLESNAVYMEALRQQLAFVRKNITYS